MAGREPLGRGACLPGVGSTGDQLGKEMERARAGSCKFSICAKGGQENGTHQCFCFHRKLLRIPVPLPHILKLANKSPSCITQAPFKLLLLCSLLHACAPLPTCTSSGWVSGSQLRLLLSQPFPCGLFLMTPAVDDVLCQPWWFVE